MEELRKIFRDARVPVEQIDGVIANLELGAIEDLQFYDKPEDYAEAGVSSKISCRILASKASEISAMLKNEAEAKQSQQITKELADIGSELLAKEIEDEVWLETLRQEGFLSFEPTTYIAALKAMLAGNLGVFKAIEKLADMIMDYSMKNALPAPVIYYKLQDVLTRRKFGAVFAVSSRDQYDGIPAYATIEDMRQLIQRIQEDFVPHILAAASKLHSWYQDLTAQKTSDYFVEHTIGSTLGSQSQAYPSPAAIYDAGVDLRVSINRTFAGNGIQKAMAICNEYRAFVDVINNPDLPKSVGAINKDAALMTLGLNGDAASVRSESQIVKFVLSLLDMRELAAGHELQFFRELYGLMMQIDWSALTGNPEDATLFNRQTMPMGVPMFGGSMSPRTPIEAQDRPALETRAGHDQGVAQLNGETCTQFKF